MTSSNLEQPEQSMPAPDPPANDAAASGSWSLGGRSSAEHTNAPSTGEEEIGSASPDNDQVAQFRDRFSDAKANANAFPDRRLPYSRFEGELELSSVPEDELKNVSRCGVPPPKWEELDLQQHIMIVVGDVDSGRKFTALQIALHLKEKVPQTGIDEFRVYGDEPAVMVRGLPELVRVRRAGELRVLVFHGYARARHNSARKPTAENWREIGRLLSEADWFLILTVSDADLLGDALPDATQITTTHARNREFLVRVADKWHSAYRDGKVEGDRRLSLSADLAAALKQLVDEPERGLYDRLKSPGQLRQYFRTLAKDGLPNDLAAIEPESRLLEFAGRIHYRVARLAEGVSATSWFRSLLPEVQLFGMLVAMFEDLPADWIHDFSRALQNRTREEGLVLPDLRARGVDQLYEELSLGLRKDGRLHFNVPVYRNECRSQVGSFQLLLWGGVDIAFATIARLAPYSTEWRLRQALGRGIGRLGYHAWPRLEAVLNDFVRMSSNNLAMKFGHSGPVHLLLDVFRDFYGDTLSQTLADAIDNRNDQQVRQVMDLIVRWAEGRKWSELRAAISAVRLCYKRIAVREASEDETRVEGTLAISQVRGRLEWTIGLIASRLFGNNWGPGPLRPLIETSLELIKAFEDMFQVAPRQFGKRLAEWIDPPSTIADEESERKLWSVDNAAHGVVGVATPTSAAAVRTEPSTENKTPQGIESPDESEDSDVVTVDSHADELTRQRQQFTDHLARGFFAISTITSLLRYTAVEESSANDVAPDERINAIIDLAAPMFRLTNEALMKEHDVIGNVGEATENAGPIELLMAFLRRAFTAAHRRDRIREVLLQAVNRSRVGPRKRITSALFTSWLGENDEHVRRAAQAVLARVATVDGDCVDAPGASTCYVLADMSAPRGPTGAIALEICRALQGKIDIVAGCLGSTRRELALGETPTPRSFRPDRPSSPLAAPMLERIGGAENRFALLVGANVVDFEDLTDLPHWMSSYGWYRPHEGAQKLSNIARGQLRNHLNGQLAALFARRTADEWRASLAPFLPESATWTPADLAAHLRECLEALDRAPTTAARLEPGRLLSCGIHWLASWDLPFAVDLLCGWLAEGDGTTSSAVAAASASSLLKVLMARAEPVAQAEAAATLAPPPREINIFRDVLQAREASPEPPTTRIASLPSAAGARPWLQLGIALAGSHSKLGLRAFINWVRRCIVQEDYRELFASRGSDDVPADLFAVARACREEYRAELANWFRDWSKPVPDWGEEAVHPAIARLGALLSRAVLVGESRSLAPLLDDERWLVVLVDPGTDDKRLGRDDLTKRLLKQLASSATKRRGVKTVLFRMGDVDPAAVDGDAAMTFVATPRELPLSPRLVAPILGRFKRDAVAAMLWISDELPLDAEDLVDDWKRFTLVFTPGQRQIPVDSPWKVEAGPSADAETTAKNWGKRTDRFVQGLDHA